MQILVDGHDLHESARRFGLPRLAMDPDQSLDSLATEIRAELFQAGRSVARWSVLPPDSTTVGQAILVEVSTVDAAKSITAIVRRLLDLLPDLGEACADIGRRVERMAEVQAGNQASADAGLADDLAEMVGDWRLVVDGMLAIDAASGSSLGVPDSVLVDAGGSLERLADAMNQGDGAGAASACGELAMIAEEIGDHLAEAADPSNPATD